MMEEVAQALARLGQRERFVGTRELVFCDELGRHLVSGVEARNFADVFHVFEVGGVACVEGQFFYRDAKILTIGEGTGEVQRW